MVLILLCWCGDEHNRCVSSASQPAGPWEALGHCRLFVLLLHLIGYAFLPENSALHFVT